MSLVYLSGLRSLNISGCVAVTDLGIMLVAQLTNLTSLDMPWCVKVTNTGLKALTPLTKLANLNISGCQLITEQGVKCLSAFTNLERLSLLNMGYSKVCVTDAALEQLAGLSKLRSLNLGSMQLSNKLVTDDSMRLIAQSHRELTQLGLMSLDISDAGVAQLAQLTKLQVRCTRAMGSACCRVFVILSGSLVATTQQHVSQALQYADGVSLLACGSCADPKKQLQLSLETCLCHPLHFMLPPTHLLLTTLLLCPRVS
jgi:hypothetical protein